MPALHATMYAALFALGATALPAAAAKLSMAAAVAVAEKHIAENGYTTAPDEQIKKKLDPESLEYQAPRAEILASRRNSLKPKAIGARPDGTEKNDGWRVTFENASAPPDQPTCRVVILNADGTKIFLKHTDMVRPYCRGFHSK